MSCTICQHPKRQEIDQALAAGSATLTTLSREYGLSTSALHRHKAHLQVKMQQAGKQLQHIVLQTCCFWLSQALEMTMEAATAARAEGNYKLLLQSISQGTRLINILLKQDFPLEDRMIYAILTSPQWPGQKAPLPDDPDIMLKIRESLAGLAADPCPEGDPPSPAPAFPAGPDRSVLPTVFSTPATPPSNDVNRKPQTDNRPFTEWEKGGKFPAYECYEFDEEEEYRLLELEKKVAQLDMEALSRGLSPKEANDKLEAIMDEIYNSIPIPKDKPLSAYLREQNLKN